MTTALTTATAQAQVEKKSPTVEDILLARQGEIGRVLGTTIDSAEFIQNAVTTIRNNPQLMRATIPSLLGALFLAAQLKLRVGGLAPQVHLTPRTVNGEMVVVPIIDYRGYLHLAHNTRMFSKIETLIVHEKDSWRKAANSERGLYFEFEEANGDRGPIVGVVGLAKLKGAEDSAWVYLTTEQVERDHRPSSWERTPWKTHREQMFRKTAIRELSKWIPNSTEMAVAAADDSAVIRKIDGIDELDVQHELPEITADHRTEAGDGALSTYDPAPSGSLDPSHPDYVAADGE